MQAFKTLALRCDGSTLWVLDQTQLPHSETWVDGSSPEAMVAIIQRLAVRGAPLIGVAAACCLAMTARAGASAEDLHRACTNLGRARPTAVNLMWAMARMAQVIPMGADALVAEAEAILQEDIALCESMAEHGAALIQEGEGLLTHCNTGGLATAGIGTALGVIRRAWEQGKRIHIFVDETRPLLQGARLTAWELKRLGIPCTLITDSMAALMLRDGQATRVLVGADRIARNGDFANKVGTYGLAVQARHHGAAFHTVAPFSTVDLACPSGRDIPIEERAEEEVRGFGTSTWAPSVSVHNPSFDVTPAHLLTSLILDRGVFDAEALAKDALTRCLQAGTPLS